MAKLTERIKNLYKFWQGIRSREISASLAFYFLTGIVPLLCLFVLIFGKRITNVIESSPQLLSGVGEMLDGLVSLSENISGTGGTVLVFTSLYSSVNLFYRFGKCGELLYKCERKNGKITGRIISFVFLIFTVLLFAVSSSVAVFVSGMFKNLFGVCISFLILFVFLLFSAVSLNLVVCPYRISIAEAIKGSFLTSFLWLLCAVGFTLYSNIISFEKYGELKCMFALMVYSYLVMQAFTAGVSLNILTLGKLKRIKQISSEFKQ